MTPEDRSKMLAHLWTQSIWPECGDVAALSVEMGETEDGDAVGFGVCGQADIEELVDLLVRGLVGMRRAAPDWLGLTQTCYFDVLSGDEPLPGNLNDPDNQTENTRHGLLVLLVDEEGIHSTGWQIDLKEGPIELPDEPVWEAHDTEVAPGVLAETLYATYVALVMIGSD